jgi:hypothetical protein
MRGSDYYWGIAARAFTHPFEARYQLIYCHARWLCVLILLLVREALRIARAMWTRKSARIARKHERRKTGREGHGA